LEELRRDGVTRTEREERWRRITRGAYGEGTAEPTLLERAVAEVVATGGVASGRVAAALLGLDGVEVRGPDVTMPRGSSNRRPGVRRRSLAPREAILAGGYCCTSALVTLCDLASEVTDLVWEQALESALRKRLVSICEISDAINGTHGADRVRRVLALRPLDAPATESILETLMVQLARRVRGLRPPTRQFEVFDSHGNFVARVDLSWPSLGIFIELDGQQHPGQPLYDARRQTAVTAATAWLCGRFTWHEVVYLPTTTARRLADVVAQAHSRPLRPAG
jgi:very-short-patch-repair endonuclease